MKYLNNTIDGKLIRIIKISDNGIYFTIYENKVFADRGLFPNSRSISISIDSVDVDHGGIISDLKLEAALQLLAITEKEFTINEDAQNWYIKTGSNGEDTLFRVTIPNKAYDNALRDKNKDGIEGRELGRYYPLWQVINFGTENIDAKFSQVTDNAIVLYLLFLNDEHKQVLEIYVNDGVVIENRD